MQEEVAELVGAKRSTIAAWEKGRNVVPPRQRLFVGQTLADAVGLPREFFTIDFSELPAILEHWGIAIARVEAGAEEPISDAEALDEMSSARESAGREEPRLG